MDYDSIVLTTELFRHLIMFLFLLLKAIERILPVSFCIRDNQKIRLSLIRNCQRIRRFSSLKRCVSLTRFFFRTTEQIRRESLHSLFFILYRFRLWSQRFLLYPSFVVDLLMTLTIHCKHSLTNSIELLFPGIG